MVFRLGEPVTARQFKVSWMAVVAASAFGAAWQATPAHAASLETVATLARGRAALESLALDRDGSFYMTSNFPHEIWQISARGEVLRKIDVGFATQVVVLSPDGRQLIVTGHDRLPVFTGSIETMQMTGLGTRVAVVDKASGKVLQSVAGPEDAFFNGLALLRAGRYLIADSIGGSLWVFDAGHGRVERWLSDESIEGSGGKPHFGGSNGLKVRGHYAYFTSRGSMWRVAIGGGAEAVGKPLRFAAIGGDDFDIARDGSIYIPGNNALMKVSPDGRTIGKVIDIGVAAPTAMLSKDQRSVYLLTRGMRASDGGEPESKLLLIRL